MIDFRILCLTLIISLASLSLSAQHSHDHGPDSLSINYQLIGDAFQLTNDSIEFDTSLFLFQLRDPLKEISYFSGGNGNIGGPYRLFDSPLVPSSEHIIHGEVIAQYLLTSENLPIYRLHTPFTEAGYSMGPNNEQLFRITHAQNLGLIDAGITYRIISSPGAYINQRSKHDKWGIYVATSPELKRLKSILSFTNNKISIGENGGLADPTQFEDTLITNRQLVDIKLPLANNSWKVSDLRFSNEYLIIGAKDSLKNVNRPFRLSAFYDLNRRRYEWDYTDSSPDTSYYAMILRDSTATHDSIRITKMSHDMGLSLYWDGFVQMAAKFGLRMQSINGTVTGLPYGLWGMGPTLNVSASRGSHQLTYLFQSLDGGNKLSTGIENNLFYHYQPNDSFRLNFSYRKIKASMPLFALGWVGNHNQYDYPGVFLSQESQQYKLNIQYLNAGIESSFERFKNLFYLNEQGIPSYSFRHNYLVRFRLYQETRREHFGIYNQVILQSSSVEDIVAVPNVAGFHSVWFGFPMFKGALYANAGLDLRYSSSYSAKVYRPDMASFINMDGNKIPAYIYTDPWITLKIQKVRFFVKLEHANSGLLGIPYYSSPAYPMPDRSFVFGLNWIFYN